MKRAMTSVLIAMLLLGSLALVNSALSASNPVPGSPQTADTLLAMLPDSDAVILINMAQLNRQLQGLVSAKAEAAAQLQKQLDRLMADTGVDLRMVDSVAIGFSLGGGEPEEMRRAQQTNRQTQPAGKDETDPVILASGRFSESQVLGSVGNTTKKKWKAETYKGTTIHSELSGGSGKSVSRDVISFLDENTLAFGTPNSVRRAIDTRAGSRASAAQNSTLVSAIGQASSSASIRFAVTVPEALKQRLASESELGGMLKPLASVNQIVGSVDLGDNGLLANISLVTPSEKEAGDVVSMINNGLSFIRMAIGSSPEGQKLANVVNGITNTQSGNSANVTVNVPADLIRELIDRVQPKAPKG